MICWMDWCSWGSVGWIALPSVGNRGNVVIWVGAGSTPPKRAWSSSYPKSNNPGSNRCGDVKEAIVGWQFGWGSNFLSSIYLPSSLKYHNYCSVVHPFCRASFRVQVESFWGTIPWSNTINLLLPSISVFVSGYCCRPSAWRATLCRGGLKPMTFGWNLMCLSRMDILSVQ